MKYSPRPDSPCILLLTWDDVRRDSLAAVRADLAAAAQDQRLENAWDSQPVRFQLVEGGYVEGEQ